MESLLDNPQFKEREAMYDAALAVGLPIVNRETCAIICAMLLVWGNHEMFTHHHRLVCELRYAQKRFHVEGGESPDPEFSAILQSYVSQLQIVQDRESRVPDHIDNMFQERYGFRFNRNE
jgi:hypothetical protein